MSDLENLVRRIADSANAAQAHYQIWFTLRGEGKALPRFYDDMNDSRYVDFFHATNAGNYKLMFIELGCLFDPDNRAASIRNLKATLHQEGRGDLVNRVEASLAGYGQLVSGILTIRSKLIAHKEISAESTDIHSQAGVIPNEIGKLLNICCGLINEIATELFPQIGLLATETNRYEQATFELLEVLRNGRS